MLVKGHPNLTWENLEIGENCLRARVLEREVRTLLYTDAIANHKSFLLYTSSVCAHLTRFITKNKISGINDQLLTFLQTASGERHSPGCDGAAFKTHRFAAEFVTQQRQSFATETHSEPPRSVRDPLLHLRTALKCLLSTPCCPQTLGSSANQEASRQLNSESKRVPVYRSKTKAKLPLK